MRLELGKIFIKDIQFASESKIENNVLYVNKDELRKAIWDDEAIVSVELSSTSNILHRLKQEQLHMQELR